MHFLSGAFLLGSIALQNVLGRPSVQNQRPLTRNFVDEFIATERPIALEQLLCNIGPDGCHTPGVSPGAVIASPSTYDPDYFYTWTRDSALVFKSLIDRFTHQYDAGLQYHIHQYITSQAKLQGVSNPSGSLADGSGLGEPKFHVDFTPFTENWGRPQRDGPALRAIAMIAYAKWLLDNGYSSTVHEVIWPILRNDLNYVAQYWNATGFDLWEEVHGSSFFTAASQHRALVEGGRLAARLGEPASDSSAIAPQILCFLQSFWSFSGGFIDANINTYDGRTGKDANTLLASIHTFDPSLQCDGATFQPCSDKALANHKQVVDSFRFYHINKGIPRGAAVAVGRYSEDVYYSGNPWYLNTLAAAEQLYDALHVWKQEGYIDVTSISRPFFDDFLPGIYPGTYNNGSDSYNVLLERISAYADGFIGIVAKYIGPSGSLAEQFSKEDGTPLSASDLTWSYASFLTSTDRRAGIVPPSWADDTVKSIPDACHGTSTIGIYSPANVAPFPPSLTPRPADCLIATSVAVTFKELVETRYGQTIKIVGNVEALGNWDVENAIALSASDYTASRPSWKVSVPLKAGQVVEYKYINVDEDGSLVWESGPNHTFTVPETCDTAAFKSDRWQH